MRLAEDSDAAFRLQGNGERLPDELRTLIELETTAERICDYEPLVIPGLLQTAEYVRALLGWGRQVADEAFELRVNARLARQQLMRRHWPPWMRFYIHEQALWTVIGNRKLMHEQLLHLVFTSSMPRIEVRVVPGATVPAAVFGGAFRMMEYCGYRPLVYTQTHTASLFLEQPDEIHSHGELLTSLATYALDEEQSRQRLAKLAVEYEGAEGDIDGATSPGSAVGMA